VNDNTELVDLIARATFQINLLTTLVSALWQVCVPPEDSQRLFELVATGWRRRILADMADIPARTGTDAALADAAIDVARAAFCGPPAPDSREVQ